MATDLVKISLYDTILYVDGEPSRPSRCEGGRLTDTVGCASYTDSGSMAFEENGERIDDLKALMSKVAYATSLFDQDGISVRFMNSRVNVSIPSGEIES